MWCLKCQSQWHETQGFITCQLTQTQASQDPVIVYCQKDTFEFQCAKSLLLYFPCCRLQMAFRNLSNIPVTQLFTFYHCLKLNSVYLFRSCNKCKSKWSKEEYELAMTKRSINKKLSIDRSFFTWGNLEEVRSRTCGLWKPGLSLYLYLNK